VLVGGQRDRRDDFGLDVAATARDQRLEAVDQLGQLREPTVAGDHADEAPRDIAKLGLRHDRSHGLGLLRARNERARDQMTRVGAGFEQLLEAGEVGGNLIKGSRVMRQIIERCCVSARKAGCL